MKKRKDFALKIARSNEKSPTQKLRKKNEKDLNGGDIKLNSLNWFEAINGIQFSHLVLKVAES